MAKDLKSMCAPGESVVFEARLSWLEVIVRGFGFGLVFLVLMILMSWALGDDDSVFAEFVVSFILTFVIMRYLLLSAIMVTDRRLLVQSGNRQFRVEEIPLGNIKEIDHIPGIFGFGEYVAVHVQAGHLTTIGNVPRPIALVQVLSALTGRSARTQVNSKFRDLYSVINAMVIACGLGGVTLFVYVSLQALHSNAWTTGIAFATVLALALVLFIPLMLLALILGYWVGSIPTFILIRYSLTPGEAEQFLRIGLDTLKPGIMKTMTRWARRISAWVLSRLYGQKIRCD